LCSVYWNGTLHPVSGTSMSTPIVSAILTLVNDALIAKGKPTLGFINVRPTSNSRIVVSNLLQPWVYSKGKAAFNDILSGAAFGCNTTQGLPAAAGWDAVTGYGTPNFLDILALRGVGSGENCGSGQWCKWEKK
jgi:tripeptidyl-peptidase I